MIRVNIVRDTSADDVRIFVGCTTAKQEDASKLQQLFNNKVGGFEFCDPEQVGDGWKTKTICQLHQQGDRDGTDGDRGNTVADCFLRVVQILARCNLNAQLSSDVKEVISEQVQKINTFALTDPYLIGLSKLGDILHGTTDLYIVNGMLEGWASFFHLTANDQKDLRPGAYFPLETALRIDEGILRSLDTEFLAPLKNAPEAPKTNPPKAPESGFWSWVAYACSLWNRFWNYITGREVRD